MSSKPLPWSLRRFRRASSAYSRRCASTISGCRRRTRSGWRSIARPPNRHVRRRAFASFASPSDADLRRAGSRDPGCPGARHVAGADGGGLLSLPAQSSDLMLRSRHCAKPCAPAQRAWTRSCAPPRFAVPVPSCASISKRSRRDQVPAQRVPGLQKISVSNGWEIFRALGAAAIEADRIDLAKQCR